MNARRRPRGPILHSVGGGDVRVWLSRTNSLGEFKDREREVDHPGVTALLGHPAEFCR